jgi:hypothetical protein
MLIRENSNRISYIVYSEEYRRADSKTSVQRTADSEEKRERRRKIKS